jgi:uncharacterized membrane protein
MKKLKIRFYKNFYYIIVIEALFMFLFALEGAQIEAVFGIAVVAITIGIATFSDFSEISAKYGEPRNPFDLG